MADVVDLEVSIQWRLASLVRSNRGSSSSVLLPFGLRSRSNHSSSCDVGGVALCMWFNDLRIKDNKTIVSCNIINHLI
jgi:hypothetical protein